MRVNYGLLMYYSSPFAFPIRKLKIFDISIILLLHGFSLDIL